MYMYHADGKLSRPQEDVIQADGGEVAQAAPPLLCPLYK